MTMRTMSRISSTRTPVRDETTPGYPEFNPESFVYSAANVVTELMASSLICIDAADGTRTARHRCVRELFLARQRGG